MKVGLHKVVLDVLRISGNDFSNAMVKASNEKIENATAGP